jgi:very-short-patch-repair endonuclease
MPTNHLNGNGCPDCGYNENGKIFKLDNLEFINRAKNIHENKYNYKLVEYNGWNNKIKIICNKHGIFEQMAGAHLCGKGCKLCNESKCEIIIKYYDFYLPKQNLLIEYDGLQHLKLVNYFGGKIAFKLRQKNDEIKNLFTKNNNFKLLRIKYNEINNINQILGGII